jgi:hypothetical protein
MIPRPLARSLVARLSGKLGYPQTNEGRKALIDAFQNAADSPTQAADVADDLQVETKYCPDVSEVWRAARALKSEKKIGCEDCDGTGWKQVDWDPINLTSKGVQRCHCRKAAA